MNRRLKFHKIVRMLSAAALAMSIAFTGVSAAGAPPRAPAAGASSEAAQTSNPYESFLGFGKGAYLKGQNWGDDVNVWSGNCVLQCTVPAGNAWSKFPLNLTYNSQANCNIGFGNNVTITYWAQLTRIDDDTVQMMTGTGAVDTYVKNNTTGRYECGDWYIETLSDGGFHAVARDGEYQFDRYGRAIKTQLYESYSYAEVSISYNTYGLVERMSIQMGASYEFEYVMMEDGQFLCVLLNQMILEYDEQGNFLSMGYQGEPDYKHYELTYNSDSLVTQYASYVLDGPVSIAYQTIGGYDRVVNYNGTQIVYGKDTTIAIGPDGAVTTWRFDDQGNLI